MSRLPVFEDAVWEFTRHRGKLHYFTHFTWGGREYRLVMTLGVKKFHVDLYATDGLVSSLVADVFNTPLVDLERFAFDSAVYYLSQATPLVGAIQDPLPFWQH